MSETLAKLSTAMQMFPLGLPDEQKCAEKADWA
jgi:hypothetical protein